MESLNQKKKTKEEEILENLANIQQLLGEYLESLKGNQEIESNKTENEGWRKEYQNLDKKNKLTKGYLESLRDAKIEEIKKERDLFWLQQKHKAHKKKYQKKKKY